MRALVGFLTVVAIAALSALAWITWEFQPWMREGQAIHLSTTRIGDYDFQVWQRKNGEPFATGLFARRQGGMWKAYLLDFEDGFRPAITLRKDGSGVAVFYGQTKAGFFDATQGTYTREVNGIGDEGAQLDSEPPGTWWVKQEAKASPPPPAKRPENCRLVATNRQDFGLSQFATANPNARLTNLAPAYWFAVDETGSVSEVKILKGTGSPEWDAHIVKNFQRWKFKPQPGCTFESTMSINIDMH